MQNDPMLTFIRALAGESMESIITDQEKQGQRDLTRRSDRLPKHMISCSKSQFEQMGIEFVGDLDDLFYSVTLPANWKIEPTDHSMWSKLIDDQGRERASIFYKAAFYDRDAHMGLTQRYGCRVDPVSGWESENRHSGEWHCVVTDCGQPVWKSDPIEPEPAYNAETRPQWLDWLERKDALANLGQAWLNEHFPDWRNPLAYW